MSKYKPFLIGSLLGAGTMFVALQFHLVQSTEGFRLVPRTPQPSLGLAYADIRTWTAEHWTDRPELARALVAHGSTDLVATSVSDGLLDSISAEGSALDKLRGLMNEGGEGASADSLFDSPGRLSIPGESSPDTAPKSDFDDLFSIPFPQDARKTNSTPQVTSTPFSEQQRQQQQPLQDSGSASSFANTAPDEPSLDDFARTPSTSVARRELPSIEEIMGGENRSFREPSQANAGTPSRTQASTATTGSDFRSVPGEKTPATSNGDFGSSSRTSSAPKSWAERARHTLSPQFVESETDAMESLLFGEETQQSSRPSAGTNYGSSGNSSSYSGTNNDGSSGTNSGRPDAQTDRGYGFEPTDREDDTTSNDTSTGRFNSSPFSDVTEDRGSNPAPTTPRSDQGSGMFQDITSSVQQRTQNVYQNARSGFQEESNNAFSDATSSLNRFVQDRVEQSLPESISSMFGEDAAAKPVGSEPLPPALKAIQDGFDPFVE